MNAYFENTYLVDSRKVDLFGMLRPSALLADLQDIATLHGTQMGVGRETLTEQYGAFWMLVRSWYRLDRPIYADEALTIRTGHRGAGGAMVYRDFDLFVDGTPVGEAVTCWVVATLAGRTLLRSKSIPELVASPVPPQTKSITLGKIPQPPALQLLEQRLVRYSDTDVNGHMNNARYADVACDAVNYAAMEGQFLSSLRVNYLKECFVGQELQVLGAQDEAARSWYVRGADAAGDAHFELAMAFSPQ